MVEFNEPEDGDHDADDDQPRDPEENGDPGGADEEAGDVSDVPDEEEADDAVEDEAVADVEDVPEDDDEEGDDDDANPEDDDIEDEFAEFIDEEMGYADIDWDTIPQKQVDEHDKIRAMSLEELGGLDPKKLNDFALWAAARAFLDHGDEATFTELSQKLLGSKKRSKALDYVDIGLALMGQQARRGDFDAAFTTLDRLAAVADGDQTLAERFRGILTIQKGERTAGLEHLAQLAETRPDDAEFLLSLGEDLCGIGMWEPALEYLEIAEELARSRSDNDLLASIENAAQFAQRHLAFDDVEDDA